MNPDVQSTRVLGGTDSPASTGSELGDPTVLGLRFRRRSLPPLSGGSALTPGSTRFTPTAMRPFYFSNQTHTRPVANNRRDSLDSATEEGSHSEHIGSHVPGGRSSHVVIGDRRLSEEQEGLSPLLLGLPPQSANQAERWMDEQVVHMLLDGSPLSLGSNTSGAGMGPMGSPTGPGNCFTQILPHPHFPCHSELQREEEAGFGPLFLSSIAYAMSKDPAQELRQRGIKAVVSVLADVGEEIGAVVAACGIDPANHLRLTMDDTTNAGHRANSTRSPLGQPLLGSYTPLGMSLGMPRSRAEVLEPIFLRAAEFITAKRREGKGVMVHCDMGIMRSPSIITGHLLQHYQLDFRTAVEFMRVAAPRCQLRLFSGVLARIAPKSDQFAMSISMHNMEGSMQWSQSMHLELPACFQGQAPLQGANGPDRGVGRVNANGSFPAATLSTSDDGQSSQGT